MNNLSQELSEKRKISYPTNTCSSDEAVVKEPATNGRIKDGERDVKKIQGKIDDSNSA